MYLNENKLTALLRHIRNALAHGTIYIYRKRKNNVKNSYIFLQDFDKNKKRLLQK